MRLHAAPAPPTPRCHHVNKGTWRPSGCPGGLPTSQHLPTDLTLSTLVRYSPWTRADQGPGLCRNRSCPNYGRDLQTVQTATRSRGAARRGASPNQRVCVIYTAVSWRLPLLLLPLLPVHLQLQHSYPEDKLNTLCSCPAARRFYYGAIVTNGQDSAHSLCCTADDHQYTIAPLPPNLSPGLCSSCWYCCPSMLLLCPSMLLLPLWLRETHRQHRLPGPLPVRLGPAHVEPSYTTAYMATPPIHIVLGRGWARWAEDTASQTSKQGPNFRPVRQQKSQRTHDAHDKGTISKRLN